MDKEQEAGQKARRVKVAIDITKSEAEEHKSQTKRLQHILEKKKLEITGLKQKQEVDQPIETSVGEQPETNNLDRPGTQRLPRKDSLETCV